MCAIFCKECYQYKYPEDVKLFFKIMEVPYIDFKGEIKFTDTHEGICINCFIIPRTIH